MATKNQTPEQKARDNIDRLLTEAEWVLQDRDAFDRNAALGVAVREFPLPAGHCDYLLFVEGKAAGVIEAKKTGVTLSGVADQSEKYVLRLPEHLARWDEFLIFHYESTGEETFFRNLRDPKARSRRLFAFHRPETLHDWVRQPETLRARLRHMPPLDPKGLRDCQIDAITGLEESLAEDKPRSLIQLATGAGKTFTACSFSYRLIKEAGAKRILFLVDRNNLGDQTLREFQAFQPPGAANRFTDTYIVQHLHSHRIDPDAKVVITTIQRLYSMLRGQELSEEEEEASGFEKWQGEDGEPLPLAYNPDIPIETFDFIVTDECHRSIYGLWRQVLEYFDASIIGLTATPSRHTLGFFNQNLVAEYPYERSVADGVNVGYEIYRIRTRVTEKGGKVEVDETGFQVPVRDKRTRKVRYEQLDADLEYTAKELDRSVVNLYLHGIGNGGSPVVQGDALANDGGDRFKVVLTNPPFGKKSSYKVVGEDGTVTTERENYEREDFKFTTSNKQFNFLQHIMTILEANGRAGVVLPDNVLFEAGRAGEGIRKRLLEGFKFHTLLRLPTGIWYSPGVKANVLFFDKRPASREVQTKELWVYDYRTNVHKTLKTKRLVSADFDDFVRCYHERKETERFRRFRYEELAKRDKLNLDIFWLKDDSLEDIDSLPDPEVLSAEIVENLEAALEQFRSVSQELGEN